MTRILSFGSPAHLTSLSESAYSCEGAVVAVVRRVTNNMRAAAFTDDEIGRMVKALYVTNSKQDAREAWAVLDRRKTGTMPRSELEDALMDIVGEACRRDIRRLLLRLPPQR